MSLADTDYLKSHVGDALTQGLSAIAVKQPDDPVEFLGNFLVSYVDTKQKKAEAEAMMQKVAADEKAAKAAADAEKAAAAAKSAESANRQKAQEDLQKKLEETPNVVGEFESLLAMLQSETGATSTYIGRKETTAGETPVEQIQYIAASSNNQSLVGKTLAKPAGEGDEEGAAEGTGVTFDLWTPVEGEDAEGQPTSTMPDYKHVENVIRDAKVSFFGIPKLGAYLAVPCKYESYLHPAHVH